MSATPTSFEADRPGPGARGAGARGVLGRLYRRDLAGYPATGPRMVYLAIVVGWILSVQITGSTATDVFSQVAWQFGEFVAIIAGALWYLAVLTLTPDARTRVRVGWFVLGVALLLPWPILLVLI